MKFKTLALSLTFVCAGLMATANNVLPADAVTVDDFEIAVDDCTVSGSVDNGSVKVEYEVSAETCAEAAEAVTKIAEALDE